MAAHIVYIAPRTWFGRLLGAIAAIALIFLALFFFTVFVAVFSMLAVVVVARILWAQRQTRRKINKRVIDGEYSVEREAETQKQTTSNIILPAKGVKPGAKN